MAKTNTPAQATGENANTNQLAADTNTATPAKKATAKSKEARGIPANWVSTWFALSMPEADRDNLIKVAKVRKIKVGALLEGFTKWAIGNPFAAEIAADIAKYDADPTAFGGGKPKAPQKPIEEMTAEELTAFEKKSNSAVTNAEKALERAKAAIEAARAAQAAKNAQAAQA